MKLNYDLEMEKQMREYEETTPLLLHACCAPCSSAVLERIASYFQITIYYYNPNISKKEEYEKRLQEVRDLLNKINPKYPVKLIEGDFENEKFEEMAKGLEQEPERGKRCYKCYELRLKETAKKAEELGFPLYATTLTLSPHKNATWINEIGHNLEESYLPKYLYSDFKKKNGYQRSIELSKKYHLYRQNYCGCIYSMRSQEEE